jgi:hypothetical protein
MLFKKKKTNVDVVVFRKACLVIDSCTNYSQLRNAMNYADLFYSMYQDFKTYTHLQKLIGVKMKEINLN